MKLTLDEIKKPIATEMDAFEHKFRDAMKSKVSLLDKIMHYIVKRKGKQMPIHEEFFGRKREQEVLSQAFRSNRSEFIPVYGRRRVGKSTLILEFLAKRTGIYHVGKRAPEPLQIHEFLQCAACALKEPLLESFPATDWKSALTAVVNRWKRKEKLIIVLDEFQWTVEYSTGLPSILQELWDRDWRKYRPWVRHFKW